MTLPCRFLARLPLTAALALAIPAAGLAGEGVAWHERAASWRTSVRVEANGADPQWAVTVARRSEGRFQTASLLGARDRAGSAEGLASYYSEGQLTASGERFDPSDMTAAHRTLPMGTKVRVTHLGSGRAVVVRINDRGPFISGRVIDLSEAAADAIGMRSAGLAAVRLDVVHD